MLKGAQRVMPVVRSHSEEYGENLSSVLEFVKK